MMIHPAGCLMVLSKFTRLVLDFVDGWIHNHHCVTKRTHQKGLPPTWADNVPTLKLSTVETSEEKMGFQQKTVTSI